MQRSVIDARFYDTYYFVSSVHDILGDIGSYLQLLNEFTCDGQHFSHSRPFPRYSAFHCFLEHVIHELLTESTEQTDLSERKAILRNYREIPEALDDLRPCTLPIEEMLKHHGLDYEPFTDWLQARGRLFSEADENDLCDFLSELRLGDAFDKLLIRCVREAFYVLFGNRGLLLNFNQAMAQELTMRADEEIPEDFAAYFDKPGVLKRASVPEWVKRAIFFRDRGRCVACDRDLTGLVSVFADEHYDHAVPLAAGGLNDVTNIQLLCGACNRKKGHRRIVTSSSYEDWYQFARRDE